MTERVDAVAKMLHFLQYRTSEALTALFTHPGVIEGPKEPLLRSLAMKRDEMDVDVDVDVDVVVMETIHELKWNWFEISGTADLLNTLLMYVGQAVPFPRAIQTVITAYCLAYRSRFPCTGVSKAPFKGVLVSRMESLLCGARLAGDAAHSDYSFAIAVLDYVSKDSTQTERKRERNFLCAIAMKSGEDEEERRVCRSEFFFALLQYRYVTYETVARYVRAWVLLGKPSFDFEVLYTKRQEYRTALQRCMSRPSRSVPDLHMYQHKHLEPDLDDKRRFFTCKWWWVQMKHAHYRRVARPVPARRSTATLVAEKAAAAKERVASTDEFLGEMVRASVQTALQDLSSQHYHTMSTFLLELFRENVSTVTFMEAHAPAVFRRLVEVWDAEQVVTAVSQAVDSALTIPWQATGHAVEAASRRDDLYVVGGLTGFRLLDFPEGQAFYAIASAIVDVDKRERVRLLLEDRYQRGCEDDALSELRLALLYDMKMLFPVARTATSSSRVSRFDWIEAVVQIGVERGVSATEVKKSKTCYLVWSDVEKSGEK